MTPTKKKRKIPHAIYFVFIDSPYFRLEQRGECVNMFLFFCIVKKVCYTRPLAPLYILFQNADVKKSVDMAAGFGQTISEYILF